MAQSTWFLLAWLLAIPAAAQHVPGETLTPPCTIREDLTTRPDPDGVATEISVGIYVINIEDIDGVHETFSADFLVMLRWQDARVAQLDLPRESCPVSSDQIWDPQVVLFNKRVARQEWELAEVGAAGNVWLSRRFSATLNSPLNLREFPFDTQTLPITLISFLCDGEARFALNRNETGRDPDFEISGWSFGPGVPTVDEYVAALGDSTVTCPRFDYRFEAGRRFGFYGWKVIAPLILIVLMSWSVFWIDPTQVIQLGVATTSVLTMIAWLFTVSHFLPTIDYLTRIDYLVFAALLLVFFTLVEAVVACYLAGRDKVAQARRLDRWCRIVFPALFTTAVLVFWWPHI